MKSTGGERNLEGTWSQNHSLFYFLLCIIFVRDYDEESMSKFIGACADLSHMGVN